MLHHAVKSEMFTEEMFLQFLNASVAISVTLLPIETVFKLLQSLKAKWPILETSSPIMTVFNPLQPSYLYIALYQ